MEHSNGINVEEKVSGLKMFVDDSLLLCLKQERLEDDIKAICVSICRNWGDRNLISLDENIVIDGHEAKVSTYGSCVF